MKRIVPVLLVLVLICAFVAAGCGSSDVKSEAEKQISAAKAALDRANADGVKVPENESSQIAKAEAALKNNSVQALILSTEAKANIENDITDAFNLAQSTYDVAKGAAQTIISKAPAGTNLTQANQSIATGDQKAAAAKTIDDWYNATSGAIYYANLAAQQAEAAALAQSSASASAAASAAELQRVQQGASQILKLMSNYLLSIGANPADYKLGITKISSDANWATGAATLKTPKPGANPVSFLFQYENGNWVLRAAPAWTAGQFGAPSDMLP